jgi:hypothetical protein
LPLAAALTIFAAYGGGARSDGLFRGVCRHDDRSALVATPICPTGRPTAEPSSAAAICRSAGGQRSNNAPQPSSGIGLRSCEAAIFVLDGATLWSGLRAVGVGASFPSVFAAYMLAALARTMGIVPGGLGTFEAVCVGGLRITGVPLGGALAATLLFRGLSFWLALAPGMVFARRASRGRSP